MNGVEVCKKLRSIPHHKSTPVIFVTLYDDFQNRTQSLQNGGDDFISKPISPFELIVKATVFLLNASKPPASKLPAQTTTASSKKSFISPIALTSPKS